MLNILKFPFQIIELWPFVLLTYNHNFPFFSGKPADYFDIYDVITNEYVDYIMPHLSAKKKLTFLIKWLSYCPLYLKQILHFCQIYGKTRLLSRELWRNNYHKLYVWSKCIFVWKRFFVHYQICQLWSFLFYIFKRWNFLFSGKPDINFFYYCHDYNRK